MLRAFNRARPAGWELAVEGLQAPSLRPSFETRPSGAPQDEV
jgi:hypothetical protein